MKKLLILIALALPVLSFGQVQLGLNAGASFKNGVAPCLSARVMKNNKAAVIGFAVDAYRYSGTMEADYYGSTGKMERYTDSWNYIAINPNVFANYKLSLVKGYAYAGLTIGYYYAPVTAYSQEFVPGKQWTTEFIKGKDNQHALNFGGQVGYCLDFTNKLSLNFEAAVRHVSVQKKGFTHFPVSAGLRYSL